MESESSVALKEISSARKRALISIFLNSLLALFKAWFGILSGSAALIGDAIHSATDICASGAAYIGLWIADKRHPSFPFGLYKAENIATLVVSIFIIIAGYEIGRSALLGPERMTNILLALPVAVSSFVVCLSFGLYQMRSGKRLGSPALIADGRDYLADSLSTAIVIVGLVGSYFGLALDRYAAIGVAIFVFRSGAHILVSSLRDLLDATISPEVRDKIIQEIEKHPQVKSVEKCIGRSAGGRIIINVDVLLRTKSHEAADKIADRLEEEIYKEFPRVIMAHIRTHYGHLGTYKRITPVNEPNGDISVSLARAPWFLIEVIDASSQQVKEKEYVQNPYAGAESRRGYLTGSWLQGLNPDELRVWQEKGGTALLLLQEAGVKIVSIQNQQNGASVEK